MNAAPLPERTVLGVYEIRSVLGRGGGGVSYRAYDSQLERAVVLKEHLPHGLCTRLPGMADVQALDGELYARSLDHFCREARILAGLCHPGVVQVHDIFMALDTAYMVMDYVEGQSLADWLPEHVQECERVEGVLQSLLEVLVYIHRCGVLHRDIKPGNIIVREDGTPVLIDFGAAMLGSPETTLTLIGSPGYAPPEQFKPHGEVGPWSDLYALAHTFLALIPAESLKRYHRAFSQSLVRASRPLIAERYADAAAWLAEMRGKRTRHRWTLAVACGLVILAAVGAVLYYLPLFGDAASAVAEQTTPAEQPRQAEFLAPAAAKGFLTVPLQNPPMVPDLTELELLGSLDAMPQKEDDPVSPLAQKMKDAAAAATEYDLIKRKFDDKSRQGWKTPEELEQALDEVEAAHKRHLEALQALQQAVNQ